MDQNSIARQEAGVGAAEQASASFYGEKQKETKGNRETKTLKKN
jgi:hypothetical protein